MSSVKAFRRVGICLRSKPSLFARRWLCATIRRSLICHGNCIKTDNRPSNLRYATRSENLRDSHAMGVNRGGRPLLYPWEELAVGETFQSNTLCRASIKRMVWEANRRFDSTFDVAKAANDDGSWTVTRVA
ncbi:HNH endonuclease [Brevundimonas sp. EYE_349]|uniref:HNH endonuclease n=1 Tax=Brevundimonas sp. EYE_349 TaxID=2853455 RepID=UPI002006588D|nr:HNH endonuclease [Brevundimonas sp. EYE_349]MCK6103346.1 HNH endonuclease [Brevundimonas sp. EYE_349]